jgi:FixJ family two-component response regulator
MNEPTVFIIDDDQSVRSGLTRLVQTAGIRTESYGSARDFLVSEKINGPGCIVLDIKMPEMTGPELQEELLKTAYGMPIIFLSGYGDVPTTVQAIKKGAVDFLTKPVDHEDLMNAIRQSLTIDAKNRNQLAESSAIKEQLKTLTPREYEIMTYVITGMLNKQIAAELAISEETIKIHRGRVMHKLKIVSVAELVRICEKAGIAPAHRHPA